MMLRTVNGYWNLRPYSLLLVFNSCLILCCSLFCNLVISLAMLRSFSVPARQPAVDGQTAGPVLIRRLRGSDGELCLMGHGRNKWLADYSDTTFQLGNEMNFNCNLNKLYCPLKNLYLTIYNAYYYKENVLVQLMFASSYKYFNDHTLMIASYKFYIIDLKFYIIYFAFEPSAPSGFNWHCFQSILFIKIGQRILSWLCCCVNSPN